MKGKINEEDMELWKEDIQEYLESYLTKVRDIPFLNFKEDWLVQFVPNPSWYPSDLVVIRFLVKLKGGTDITHPDEDDDMKEVSVVLLNELGGILIWEVQNSDDEMFRCDVEDLEKLYEIIEDNL